MTAGVDVEQADVVELLSTGMLDVDGGALTGRDLLAAGVVSGRWQRLEMDLAEGLGLVAGEAPAEAEVNAELRAFRFDRGLLSAEDMRAWMDPRGLTVSAVKAVAARIVARRNGGTAVAAPAAETAAALVPEAICTGALTEIGWWLADRMLSSRATGAEIVALPLQSARVQRLVFAEACTAGGRASAQPGLLRAQRLALFAALDDAHREWEVSVAGDRELARRLREHELDWCRYELDELRLASPGAAAEVARQLAEGVDPKEVAAVAGVPVTVRRIVPADVPEELARSLAGAIAGEVAGPWEDGEDRVVALVRARQMPSLDDAQLVERARAELVAEAAIRLRTGRVRWHERS